MYFIVDRIEGDIVVLEGYDKSHIEVNGECFDFMVREGDVVKKDNDRFFKDEEQTTLRKKRIMDLSKKLFGE